MARAKRSEGPQTLERYLTGLLTEHPNKNCDTIAQVVPGTSEQRLQGLFQNPIDKRSMTRLKTNVPGPDRAGAPRGTSGSLAQAQQSCYQGPFGLLKRS
jgi:hypothetical protein